MCLSFAFTSEAYLTYIIYHHTSYIYICIYVYIIIHHIYVYVLPSSNTQSIPISFRAGSSRCALSNISKTWPSGTVDQKAWYRNMNRMVLRAMFNMNMYVYIYIYILYNYIYILYIDYIQPLTKSTIIHYHTIFI